MKGMSNTEAYFMRMAGTLYRSAYEEGYANGKKDCIDMPENCRKCKYRSELSCCLTIDDDGYLVERDMRKPEESEVNYE